MCPKCKEDVPDGMRFCLQCGASLATPPAPPDAWGEEGDAEAPEAVPAPPRGLPPPAPDSPPPKPAPRVALTVPLKIAATPVITPHAGEGADRGRLRRPEPTEEIDEEFLKAALARTPPSDEVLCRFCKGPLDLAGDFCEQCGAPVEEAAPAGALNSQPTAPPATLAPATSPSAPPGASPAGSAPPHLLEDDPLTPPVPAGHAEPDLLASPDSGAPGSSAPPATPPVEKHPTGFMGRLKGIFKKS